MFKILFSRKRGILKKIKEYQIKSLNDNNYYLSGSRTLEAQARRGNDISYYLELCEEWDNKKPIPLDIGYLVEDMINDPNIRFGIHRKQVPDLESKGIESEVLYSIFTDGLTNTGALWQNGAVSSNMVEPYQTVSFNSSLIDNFIHLKTHYHDSDGALLIAFPSEYVDSEGRIIPGHEYDVYNFDENNQPSIKPEFFVGFLTNNQERCEFFSAEDIRNNHRSR